VLSQVPARIHARLAATLQQVLLDLLQNAGGPLLSAVIGGLIVHVATRRRDALNERRRQRIDYLLKAYRTLTHSAHRDLSAGQAEAFENALSDVVLLGDGDQIRLARKVIVGLATGGKASVDELLVSFRTALRRELNLKNDSLQQVPVVRFKGLRTHAPLKVQESWEVNKAETETAAASAVTELSVTATTSAEYPWERSIDLGSQVEALRELAGVAPGAAVVTAYEQVRMALKSLVGAEESDARDAPELAREAEARRLIGKQAVVTIEGLAVMKNLSRRKLTAEQANDYVDLVAAMLYVLHYPQPHAKEADGAPVVKS